MNPRCAAAILHGEMPQLTDHARVLLVDDDPDHRFLLRRLLVRKVGVDERGISSLDCGEGCVERVTELLRRGREVVLLLDLQMPRVDGWAVLDALSREPLGEHPGRLHTYVVSTSPNPDDRERVSHYTFVRGFLEKLPRVEALRRALRVSPQPQAAAA